MLKKKITNNVFLRKNKFDVSKVSFFSSFFGNCSDIRSLPLSKRLCLGGLKMLSPRRTSFKFSCNESGSYGSKVGWFPMNRFVLLKKMTFNRFRVFSKKS